MGHLLVPALLLGLAAGCDTANPVPRSDLDQQMFGPVSIRIHPTFTQVRDWNGDGKQDGIEAMLEVHDQFDEPARSTGRVVFELYEYRKTSPQIRGRRIGGPWNFSLDTRQEQQDRWNPALRAYTFQLPYPQVAANRYYVLTVEFTLNGDGGVPPPATRPATEPSETQPSETQPLTGNSASEPAAPQPLTHPAGRLFDTLIIAPEKEESGHGHHKASSRTPGR